jgi:transcriptional antiterminator RfaH
VKVNPVNPRSAKVRPYFPNYLFVHVDIDEVGINTFKWMPYAQGLVSFDENPASVPDPVIEKLKRTIQTINSKGGLKFDEIKPGDIVQVIGGPFEGYEGIFDTRISGTDRIKILLQLLSDRQIPVEMQIGQIQTKK